MHGVGKIDNVHAHCREISFKLQALGRAPPVVPFEKNVEGIGTPGVDLAREVFRNRIIYKSDIANDFQTFCQRNYRRLALGLDQELIGDNAGNQEVAFRFGLPQQIQVAYMK